MSAPVPASIDRADLSDGVAIRTFISSVALCAEQQVTNKAVNVARFFEAL